MRSLCAWTAFFLALSLSAGTPLGADDGPRIYGSGPGAGRDDVRSGGSFRGGQSGGRHFGHHHRGSGFHYHASSAFIPASPNGFSFFFGPFAVGGWSHPYGANWYGGNWGSFGPSVWHFQPGGVQPFIENAPPLQEWMNEADEAWNAPLSDLPVEELPRRYVKPSSTAAQLRAIRLQHEGDLQMRNLQFTTAANRYGDAIAAAPDLAEPYFHLAVAEAARGNFREAVLQLKFGLQLDPTWPSSGESLDELIGEQNLLAKTQVKQRVLDWVQEDIRDPDRLFLMGALLHIDNDTGNAAQLLETAARLGGKKDYLAAFLDADATQAVAVPAANVDQPQQGGVLPPPPPAPNEPIPAAPTPPAPSASEPVLPPPPVLN